MSNYSDDFNAAEKEISKDSIGIKSQESHHEAFEKNLDALREEIKVLEVEQLQNLDIFNSVDTIEFADDSSEDDFSFVQMRKEDLKTRSKSRQTAKTIQKDAKVRRNLISEHDMSKPYSFYSKSSNKKYLTGLGKELKNNDNVFFYSRPKQIVSAVPDLKSFNRYSKKPERKNKRLIPLETHEKYQEELEPDWKRSILESYLSSNLLEFNWENDEMVLTEGQIFQNKGNFSQQVLVKTYKKLCKEMFFCKKFNQITLRVEIQRLLITRRTILSLLRSIHEREDLLITILTLGKEAGQDLNRMYEEYLSITKEILVHIQKVKDSVLGLKNFVYFGEDYEKKIRDDTRRIQKLKLP